jgi:hypothetical protein
LPFSPAAQIFRLVSYRSGTPWKSTAIAPNEGVKDWPEIFAGSDAPEAAILDRRLRGRVVVNVRGRSYRLKDREMPLK